MSCEKNKKAAATAAITTGITQAASSYLNSVGVSAGKGNTDLYRDMVRVAKTMTGFGLSPSKDPVADVANAIGFVGKLFFNKSGSDEGGGGGGDGESGDGESGDTGYGQRAKQALKYLKPPSVMGTVLGIHSLERATGSVATLGVRTVARGKPLGSWNGVIVRESRFTPTNAKMLNRLTGGRVLNARGYYFHEGGRTWHAQSFTVDVQGTPKSLTCVRSFAIPRQEHFFDRPLVLGKKDGLQQIGDDAVARGVAVTRMIDVVKGQENPKNIPGYIGSTSRLDNAANIMPLGAGKLKRTLFAARWLLEDESERDNPAARNTNSQTKAATASTPRRPVLKYGRDGKIVYDYTGVPLDRYNPRASAWPTSGAGQGKPYGQDLFNFNSGTTPAPPKKTAAPQETVISSAPAAPPAASAPPETAPAAPPLSGKTPPPGDGAGLDKISLPNGQEHPLVVKRVMTNPITMKKSAEAAYHDGERWRMVVDDDTKQWLAEEVRDGNLKENPAGWQKHVKF